MFAFEHLWLSSLFMFKSVYLVARDSDNSIFYQSFHTSILKLYRSNMLSDVTVIRQLFGCPINRSVCSNSPFFLPISKMSSNNITFFGCWLSLYPAAMMSFVSNLHPNVCKTKIRFFVWTHKCINRRGIINLRRPMSTFWLNSLPTQIFMCTKNRLMIINND